MIENSIYNLFDTINNSKEYEEYKNIVNILEQNKEIKILIDEIKSLEQKATKLEYNNDEKYKEIDKEIEEKYKLLKNNKEYQEYLDKLKKFNNALLASSSLLEEYIDNKVSI